ncbi:MAG TPA: polymer-forming cytoskeletal protein [Thermoanaerobaculia bacterium]|nr:polymer-forming cytoskeletal protein [Thermoanaerobaculia bacterium]
MSIFGRRDSKSPTSASSGGTSDATLGQAPSSSKAQQRRITHIAPGSRVQGELTGPTELLIEGEVEGEIRVDATVMVGTEGVVHGPVSAHVVRIGGRVFGSVSALERVEVAPSGTLEGDVSAPRIVIAEGAFFKGRVEMKGDRPDKPEKMEKAAQEKAEEARHAKGAGEPGRQPKTSVEPGKA